MKLLSCYQYTGMKALYFASRHLQVIFSNSNCAQDVRPKYFQVSSSIAESSKKVVKIDCLKIYIINTFNTFTIPYRFWPNTHCFASSYRSQFSDHSVTWNKKSITLVKIKRTQVNSEKFIQSTANCVVHLETCRVFCIQICHIFECFFYFKCMYVCFRFIELHVIWTCNIIYIAKVILRLDLS